jgi:hypothetical protein
VTDTTQSASQFSSLPLHDATLKLLRIDWTQRTCVAELDVFLDRSQDAVPGILTWHAVTDIVVPHRDPWGPSTFINASRFEPPAVYVIEMQSGDHIRITAEHFEFSTPSA